MKVLNTIKETREVCRTGKSRGRLGLVPTMGALHDGHLSLARAAKEKCDVVAVSLFVNPTQFGPSEDLSKYPRTFEQDRELLEKEGVDFLFAPTVAEMYPPGATTFVTVEGLSDRLDGKSRPGHFRGVTTVVSKLFHIIEPDLAFFGQKDAAQCAVIRRMVRDLDMPVEIVVCPIVRESDGLALSSRNVYLDAAQRKSALVLSRSLRKVQAEFEQGRKDAASLIATGKNTLNQEPAVRLDYFEIVNPDTLEPTAEIEKPALAAVAAFVGNTRLIDNVVLRP
jgi:pantoate--beta-alanine ligase